MRRHALLIGNTRGLSGVEKDIRLYISFLKDNIGGEWYDSEIEIALNASVSSIKKSLKNIKMQNYDFIMLIFSGHGAYGGRNTILEINDKGDILDESYFQNLAKRQISIFDCCRVHLPHYNYEHCELTSKKLSWQSTRIKYEMRIMQAAEQQVSLYACSVGESSSDTSNGGMFTTNFIKFVGCIGYAEYKLVSEVFSEAAVCTAQDALYIGRQQHPDIVIPNLPPQKQLIISINPNYGSKILFKKDITGRKGKYNVKNSNKKANKNLQKKRSPNKKSTKKKSGLLGKLFGKIGKLLG